MRGVTAQKSNASGPELYRRAPRRHHAGRPRTGDTRDSDVVMYAGYFPMGLSLQRIWRGLPDAPFREEVWPKFLRDNAIRIYKIDE